MPTPEQNPTDPRPDQAPASPSTGGAVPDQNGDQDQNASGNPEAAPSSTQENMGDGAGIRGDYGNASQTNGLEGGPEAPADMTDTELTGS